MDRIDELLNKLLTQQRKVSFYRRRAGSADPHTRRHGESNIDAAIVKRDRAYQQIAEEWREMVEALESVEWVRDCNDDEVCAWCEGWPIDDEEIAAGLTAHAPECQRQVALARAKGQDDE